jgi:hypothetical protein
MPFRHPFNSYYEKLYAPTLRKLALEPKRGDDLFRPGAVIENVWALVKASRVLVADLTGGNPNVYYELGLAHALGKPVVLVAAALEDIPFDLRHLNRLIYDKDDPAWGVKLVKSLRKSLTQVLADEVHAIPGPFLAPSRFDRRVEEPATTELRAIRTTLTTLADSALGRKEPIIQLSEDERRALSAAVHSLGDFHSDALRHYQADVFPFAEHLVKKK